MKKTNGLLKKYIWISILAAILTIALKIIAWLLTDSVGLLSDAMESLVNLAAAVLALILLTIAQKPADEKHTYGHTKSEYFSSAIEGALIIIAAGSIIYAAVPRLSNPKQIENVEIGLLISGFASLINLVVGVALIRNGKKHKSILIEADGKHLLTDVWTSFGVIIGIILVKITGWHILDPILAIGLAINIIISGAILIKRSADGLMDAAIDETDLKKVKDILDAFAQKYNIEYHSLLTRQAGQRIFISVHILIPGKWTVKQGHDLSEEIELLIRELFLQPTNIITHIEPIEDPISFKDIKLDRRS